MEDKKYDVITILLSLFIVVLFSLFYYLYSVEHSIHNYTQNHDVIIELERFDLEIEDFSQTINQLYNYDTINKKLNAFEKSLSYLRIHLREEKSSYQQLKQKLDNIESLYFQTKEDIEYFKSLNAALISGSHFLFDLQSTITEDENLPLTSKNLVNETLFYLLRFTMSDYIDQKYINQKLIELKRMGLTQKTPYIDNFYKQTHILLKTIAKLKEIANRIKNRELSDALVDLDHLLDRCYQENLYVQKTITSIFFLFTIGILILLIVNHRRSLKNKEELYAFKYAVQHSDNTIVITDPQRHITFVNDVFERSSGYTKEEALGKNPSILKSDKHDASFYKEMNEKLNRGEKWEGEFINKRKDGSLFYEKASIVPVFLNRKLIAYLAIKLDITEYIEQNMKLKQAATVFENTEEAIIIADKEAHIISVNPAFTKIYGYTLEEVRGKHIRLIHSGEQDKNFYKNMWNQITQSGFWKGKILNKTKDGERIPLWVAIKRIDDKFGNVVNYTAVQTDLREIESYQAKADYLAYHDPLTGLYNRINFEEYLLHALLVAKRNKTQLAVLFIDLDQFKDINDTLGHDIGDEVLKVAAMRLKKTLRESDFIARWGGDEFVVIIENLKDAGESAVVANTIIEHMQQPMEIQNHHLMLTASIGIALYPQNGDDVQTLLKHADSAMYLAKDMGKNNFRYYTEELSEKIQYKLNINMALHSAIEKSEIYMVFQPQYSLSSKEIVSVEALVRWENEKLGFVPPDKFIPIAEDSGAIVSIGYFIFEASCRAFAQMRRHHLKLERIAINVSSIQFKEEDLLERFLEIVQRYELNPGDIEIEITERFIMEHTTSNITMLQRFQDSGFQISIDDFGTGYSSMAYLKKLPIDTIKIDKSFVDDIVADIQSVDNAVVAAIVALSSTLGYKSVAEGIEDPKQEKFLAEVGCDIGQGYYFAKPMRLEALIERFAKPL